MVRKNGIDMKGATPESWCCVDCSVNTAPGWLGRAEMEKVFADETARAKLEGRPENGIELHFDEHSEVYHLKESVWEAAGMAPYGGCLCIRCVETRLGRQLQPKDFARRHPFYSLLVGTPRLLNRKGFIRDDEEMAP
jgi:hypothetical protein